MLFVFILFYIINVNFDRTKESKELLESENRKINKQIVKIYGEKEFLVVGPHGLKEKDSTTTKHKKDFLKQKQTKAKDSENANVNIFKFYKIYINIIYIYYVEIGN
jgi:hypothetical protein